MSYVFIVIRIRISKDVFSKGKQNDQVFCSFTYFQSTDFCTACKDVVAEIRALDRNQEFQV